MTAKIIRRLLLTLSAWWAGLIGLADLVAAQPARELTNEDFDTVNPLRIANSPYADILSTPRGILSRVMIFAFPLAGLILFVMLVWGGFEMVQGATTKKSLDAGKQRITAALVGFFLLFMSYWIVRMVEFVFGVKIF